MRLDVSEVDLIEHHSGSLQSFVVARDTVLVERRSGIRGRVLRTGRHDRRTEQGQSEHERQTAHKNCLEIYQKPYKVRDLRGGMTMKNKTILGALILCVWGVSANAMQAAPTCDRECLRGKVTQLLYAFLKH